MFTTQFNAEMLRQRSATPASPSRRHLLDARMRHPPPSRRGPGARRRIALLLARAARRLDREAARRAIA